MIKYSSPDFKVKIKEGKFEYQYSILSDTEREKGIKFKKGSKRIHIVMTPISDWGKQKMNGQANTNMWVSNMESFNKVLNKTNKRLKELGCKILKEVK